MPCLVLAGMMLAWCPCALALDPALDVSQYAHTAWKVRDGFFETGPYSIAQTPDGYLWLGSPSGLLRFDGVRTVPWQPGSGQHLASNNIFSLLATRDGTLWIGTLSELASWKDGKLTQHPQLAGYYLFKILEDHEGTIWASGITATYGKLCAFRNGTVQCYGEDGSLGRGAFNLYEDSKGNLWTGVKHGLWRWRPGPPKFYLLDGEPDGIQALGEDIDGTLLVGWNGGIHRFVDGKTEPYPLRGLTLKFQPRRMLRDRDGGLWIGTGTEGVLHVHQGRTDVFSFSDGLTGENIGGLFEDREGTIWITTANGLDRFRSFVVPTFSVKQGLLKSLAGSVLADRDGSVWMATYGGLNRWGNGQIAIPRTGSAERDGKLDGQIPNSLFQDDRGRIWISTVRGIGYLENGRFVSQTAFSTSFVLSIAQDRVGDLWVANEHLGLFQLHQGSVVQQFPWSNLGIHTHASDLAADPVRGGLWLGFHEGGVACFRDGKVLASYSASKGGLGEGRVNRLWLDRDGTLWASTEGGLSRLKDGRVTTLSSKNGLPCDMVIWVMEDDDHSLWLYLGCGLVRVKRSELDAWVRDPKRTIRTTVFDSFDGVRSLPGGNHFNPPVAKTPDGRLWFVVPDGVSVIDPHHLSFNKVPPPVQIEQITADRKTYDPPSNVNGHVPLPTRIRDLEIDYTALSLVAPEKVRFRYKLEGRDRDWLDAGTRRQAFYSDLPPRNYRFRVMACNNSGVWNEAGAVLDFSVAPAYYQTTWFRLSCVAAFLALLWAIHQQRLRRVARDFNMQLEGRVNERTRIARELHDTLLQSFQVLILNFQRARNLLPARPDRAIESLDTALDRAERAIMEGRDAIHGIRASAPADGNFAEEISALGEQLASEGEHSTASNFRVVVKGSPRAIRPVVRDEICRIAREALRNAYGHAHARTIEAEISYEEKLLRVRIRDDGIGIKETHLGETGRAGHYGLRGMRERAKVIGANLEVWSEDGAGAEIELRVPYRIAYKADGQDK